MKFSDEQFEAVTYIFERAHGNIKTDYENEVINMSGLSKFEHSFLERNIVNDLDKGVYNNSTDRISAYWVLGKRFNRNLIPAFQKWLRYELDSNDAIAVYQILIALGNMDEPVFNPKRNGSYASWEAELNIEDAKDYLKHI
ncbi:hypothetical protein [Aestuariivivens marinum]|uniref:hypothetical protein n=1 Tax=Aestuariivivens marinum TaxID=2913555 RepID=UPI001F578904|nr:hypothetical protein [Aestuariivivens marinum]